MPPPPLRRPGAGGIVAVSCPICGMALEPRAVTLEEDRSELRAHVAPVLDRRRAHAAAGARAEALRYRGTPASDPGSTGIERSNLSRPLAGGGGRLRLSADSRRHSSSSGSAIWLRGVGSATSTTAPS